MSFFSIFAFRGHQRPARRGKRSPSSSLGLEQLEDRCLPSTATISGFVFNDLNNNGLYDAGDAPVANSPIELRNAAGVVVGTAVTDSQGFYSFSTDSTQPSSNLTLTRTATVAASPSDWSNPLSVAQFDPSLGTLVAVDIVNAGSFTSDIKVESEDSSPSTITATVAGTLTLSGPGLTGLVASSSASQTFQATAFDGTIDFSGTSGHDFGAQSAPGSNSITLMAASDLAQFTGTGSVAFTEAAHANSSASGPGNRVVQINTTAGAQVTVVYHYVAGNSLQPGNYTIHQTSDPAGFLDGLVSSNGVVVPNSVGSNAINVTLGSSNSVNNDFAEVKPASLSGFVYVDRNNNGIKDSGEPGLNGVSITLTGANDLGSVNLTTTTASDGSYQFANLRPGTYSVTETPPNGYQDGKDTLGSAGGIVSQDQFAGVVLGAGTAGINYNFGELLTAVISGASYPGCFLSQPSAFTPVDLSLLSKSEFLSSSGTQTLPADVVADAKYVNGLYETLLGRSADGSGLLHWVTMLHNGSSRQQVVDGIWTSPEGRGIEVDRFYQTFLGRTADVDGRNFWINQFLSGASEAAVASQILASDEFRATHSDNASYVTALYADVLGRSAGPTETSSWVQMLQTGSDRATVALGFLNSSEAFVKIIDCAQVNYLHAAVNTTQEQAMLTSLLSGQATPKSVSEDILVSDQYFALTQQT